MINTNQIALEVAGKLLDIEAVALRPHQPFTWTSGLKSPIYCDNRLTMSYPEIRDLIAESFAGIIRSTYPQAEVIAGDGYGGDSPCGLRFPKAWVADDLCSRQGEGPRQGKFN